MAIQIQGNSGTIAETDSTYRALRFSPRPIDHGSLGHYRLSTTVGLVASQAAGSTLFSFRWADATRLCIPLYFRMECMQTVAATTTIMPTYQLVIARAFSVSDSGGVSITTTGNSMKKRTSMGSTLVANIQKSNSSSGLSAGSRTLDAESVLEMFTNHSASSANSNAFRKEIDFTNAGDHPFIFSMNEGFIVRGPSVAFGTAGAANFNIEMGWAEVNSY